MGSNWLYDLQKFDALEHDSVTMKVFLYVLTYFFNIIIILKLLWLHYHLFLWVAIEFAIH